MRIVYGRHSGQTFIRLIAYQVCNIHGLECAFYKQGCTVYAHRERLINHSNTCGFVSGGNLIHVEYSPEAMKTIYENRKRT